MNLRKNPSQSPITKIDLCLLEPQHIKFSNNHNDYNFETFSNTNLHLKPPLLTFRMLQNPKWYAGVPIIILITAKNLRFQPVTNAKFDICVISNNLTVYSNESPEISEIPAQSSISYPIRITPTVATNNFRIMTKLNYKFNDQLLTSSSQNSIQILPSLSCKALRAHGYVGFEIENLFPFPLVSVRISSSASKGKDEIIIHQLFRNEKINGFLSKSPTFDIKWSLPFAKECQITYPSIPKNAEKRKDVSFHFISETDQVSHENIKFLPKIVEIFTPFDATMHIKNKTSEKVSGTFAFSNDDYLMILGEASLHFNLEPKEEKYIDSTFIAVKEGTIQFPDMTVSFDIHSNNSNSTLPYNTNIQQIPINSGIIVVGKTT